MKGSFPISTLLFLLFGSTAFAQGNTTGTGNPVVLKHESIMLNTLMNDYGDGIKSLLVGKNVENNKPCYLNLHRGGFLKLSSVDSSGMTQDEEITMLTKDSIRLNKSNAVKIFNHDVTPSFFGHTAEANFESKESILRADFRNITKLQCEFDLENNRTLPPIPQDCGNKEIRKTIRECHFVKNIGNANHQVTYGRLDLQEVTSKKCVPGGVFENFAGYITQNGNIHYEGNSPGLNMGWHKTRLPAWGEKKNDETRFSQKIATTGGSSSVTEYTYNKVSGELVFKYDLSVGMFERRKLAAKFKCE